MVSASLPVFLTPLIGRERELTTLEQLVHHPEVRLVTLTGPGGVAKVVRSLAEADKLAASDILIAETTAPAWTPLFATVAAVVTDTGGILSHSAVLAREYRIFAVVGALNATDTFRDGQRVEVDGDKGIVRILE